MKYPCKKEFLCISLTASWRWIPFLIPGYLTRVWHMVFDGDLNSSENHLITLAFLQIFRRESASLVLIRRTKGEGFCLIISLGWQSISKSRTLQKRKKCWSRSWPYTDNWEGKPWERKHEAAVYLHHGQVYDSGWIMHVWNEGERINLGCLL